MLNPNRDSLACSNWVELRWAVGGDRLPADHNYRLYSALIDKLPALKDINWQLGTITGFPDNKGWITLGRDSYLMVRVQFCDLGLLSQLDQKYLRVGKSLIELGISEGESLKPQDSLSSRIVTVKSMDQCRVAPFIFGVSVGKKLAELGINSVPELGERKSLRIKDCQIVGYTVMFPTLRAEESLLLQAYGIGGRRKMGAGVFVGTRDP